MTSNDNKSQKKKKSEEINYTHRKNNQENNFWEQNTLFSKTQERFLIISAVIPLIIFLIQVINIIFVVLKPPIPPPNSPPQDLTISRIIDISSPAIVMIVMSIFGMVNFMFLLSLKRKTSKYREQKQAFTNMIQNSSDENESTSFVSTTQLFYDNLKHMKKMRNFSYITNAASVLYIWWVIRGFLQKLGVFRPRIPIHNPPLILQIFNLFSQVILVFYVTMQWRFFVKWNKKIVRIEIFEKQIFNELNL